MTTSGVDLSELVDALPERCVIVDQTAMDVYRWDRALDPLAGIPLAVVRATCTQDVQTAVRFAARHGIPVVPRGAGSGLSGGASAVTGCIVISLERMGDINIDAATRVAVVQPGALNAAVKAAAASNGLWYPPDPSSYEFCSIGGNVATNAGGLCCVKYGVTSNYVLGVTVVLADGTVVKLGGPRLKDVAGLSLTQLFVGSEGTLGIITEIILRLVPAGRQPATLVAFFRRLEDATSAVMQIGGHVRTSMLEFMDSTAINAVEDWAELGLDRSAAAMLLVQSDEPPEYAAQEIAIIEDLCTQCDASTIMTTSDPDEGEAFVRARRIAIPAVEQTGTLLLEDVGVPIPQLGALVLGIESIARANRVTISVIAHAGDGNTHPLIVFDPADADHERRARTAYGEIIDLALTLGGTITGEHGVGRLKRPWLADYLGTDAMALNQRIKDALDPDRILNPGAIF